MDREQRQWPMVIRGRKSSRGSTRRRLTGADSWRSDHQTASESRSIAHTSSRGDRTAGSRERPQQLHGTHRQHNHGGNQHISTPILVTSAAFFEWQFRHSAADIDTEWHDTCFKPMPKHALTRTRRICCATHTIPCSPSQRTRTANPRQDSPRFAKTRQDSPRLAKTRKDIQCECKVEP